MKMSWRIEVRLQLSVDLWYSALRGVDNCGNALKLAIADSSELRPYFRKELLGGVTVIEDDGFLLDERRNKIKKQKIFLIPYFSWANRGKTEMAVWLLRKN